MAPVALPVVAAILVLGYLGTILSINHSLGKITAVAREVAPDAGDDVLALISLVGNEDHALADRNRAVWALGQLRDPRALPVLQAKAGGDCRHGAELCRYELSKAIALCTDANDD